MFMGNSELDTLIMIFKHKGTPRYDSVLNIQDYTYIDHNFKTKFP